MATLWSQDGDDRRCPQRRLGTGLGVLGDLEARQSAGLRWNPDSSCGHQGEGQHGEHRHAADFSFPPQPSSARRDPCKRCPSLQASLWAPSADRLSGSSVSAPAGSQRSASSHHVVPEPTRPSPEMGAERTAGWEVRGRLLGHCQKERTPRSGLRGSGPPVVRTASQQAAEGLAPQPLALTRLTDPDVQDLARTAGGTDPEAQPSDHLLLAVHEDDLERPTGVLRVAGG